MSQLPDAEDLNRFRIEQAVKHENQELAKDDSASYVENELELKSNIILKPQAIGLNPMNMPDLVLGIVKDKEMKTKLDYWMQMQVTFWECGLKETARFYQDMVLTTLNLHRSHDGQQQKYIISRIKQAKIELEDEKKPNLIERSRTI